MKAFSDQLYAMVEENRPCTVRQVYYMALGPGLVEKDTSGSRRNYSKVCRTLGDMREAGELPWSWLADSTRFSRQARAWADAPAAIHDMAYSYRRNLWQRQERHIEVWVESDSIAGMLNSVIHSLGVALMPTRGQSSKTFAHSAAEEYAEIGKRVSIVYVGDFDPAGLHIGRSLEERLRRYGPGIDLEFRRIAVTPAQISDLGLTGHTTNQSGGDYLAFAALCDLEGVPVESVETEALPPAYLRQLVETEVLSHVDQR